MQSRGRVAGCYLEESGTESSLSGPYGWEDGGRAVRLRVAFCVVHCSVVCTGSFVFSERFKLMPRCLLTASVLRVLPYFFYGFYCS